MARLHHPPAPSSEEEGEKSHRFPGAPSSSEEGVGGGVSRATMLARAARMRREPTEPERRLWMALRDSRLAGFKFRRQAVIGRRIADFFCPANGLIVELDGESHARESDLARDAVILRQTGSATLRFTNRDVMENLEGVLVAVLDALERMPDRWARGRHHPPTPSSEEEGE